MKMEKGMLSSKYISILKSNEYKSELNKMAKRIVEASRKAPNEATIESRFDCELFAFFKTYFGSLGFEYDPAKEKAIATCRHVSKGKADTAISTLIIEFKQPSTLSSDNQKKKAISQITDYLKGIAAQNDSEMYEGFVTDGVQGCFITYFKGEALVEKFMPINEYALDRIIQNILALKLIAFNANNLVESFCNPPMNDGIAFELVRILYDLLKHGIQPKTKMLFVEWKELFNLAHDDVKQQAIFREYGMANLLEGDFFSWYCNEKQWNEQLADVLKRIFEILCRYSEKAVLNNVKRSQDFFKQLESRCESF